MSPPTAIITGASSGIGLALTKHLLALKWHVIMADLNPPKESLPNTSYLKTDISSWDSQASTFEKAYTKLGRLDFAALNAGMDDRDDIFASLSSESTKPPRKPSMQTFDVNLTGTYYGIKIAAHYMSLDSTAAGKKQKGGKITVTASAAGIYPLPVVPQYTASKHALVGLVRALGPVAEAADIRINAVCPALVATGLAPPGLMDNFSEKQITPMSTIMRCFEQLNKFEEVGEEDWTSSGLTGATLEGNLGDVITHEAPSRPESSEYLDEEGEKAWVRAYMERNQNFALQEWEQKSRW
nr:hypothetical protein B0A51_10702 [Rachicladosporium sp. CCFEE 5018]